MTLQRGSIALCDRKYPSRSCLQIQPVMPAHRTRARPKNPCPVVLSKVTEQMMRGQGARRGGRTSTRADFTHLRIHYRCRNCLIDRGSSRSTAFRASSFGQWLSRERANGQWLYSQLIETSGSGHQGAQADAVRSVANFKFAPPHILRNTLGVTCPAANSTAFCNSNRYSFKFKDLSDFQ